METRKEVDREKRHSGYGGRRPVREGGRARCAEVEGTDRDRQLLKHVDTSVTSELTTTQLYFALTLL